VEKDAKSLYQWSLLSSGIFAMRWYFRFRLSLRDIEELLFERGVAVSNETIGRRCK
jgi:putative transposase